LTWNFPIIYFLFPSEGCLRIIELPKACGHRPIFKVPKVLAIKNQANLANKGLFTAGVLNSFFRRAKLCHRTLKEDPLPYSPAEPTFFAFLSMKIVQFGHFTVIFEENKE